MDRDSLYLTNAVKHFRWKSTASSTRRIHQTPAASHVLACQPWLAAELRAVHPRVVVALGATAAAALFGSSFRVSVHRGEALNWPPSAGPFASDETPVTVAFVTIHPSAVLRAGADREPAYRGFVDDLRLALDQSSGAPIEPSRGRA
jgi:uracil-DNA glycosylase